ncbi:hypothetical protein NDU88_008419 [Pleurodeles waltl]|uniref:Uncharacterized protein n=1 Tax=Pleurodeles waltl TaxID=8319 RepID=A0AAV7RXL9_PLEWA|nr:hypothetical protein NDU88_008419 [Pleurodeles waltl]
MSRLPYLLHAGARPRILVLCHMPEALEGGPLLGALVLNPCVTQSLGPVDKLWSSHLCEHLQPGGSSVRGPVAQGEELWESEPAAPTRPPSA